jgi:hypothetical protein
MWGVPQDDGQLTGLVGVVSALETVLKQDTGSQLVVGLSAFKL